MNCVTTLAFAVLAAAPLCGQNLLSPNAWQAWNPALVRDLQITSEQIVFTPLDPTRAGARCGIEQTVQIPAAGLYQLIHVGGGGATGLFPGDWSVGSQTVAFDGVDRQVAQTWQLPAGPALVRFSTATSDLESDFWVLRQPILRPVMAPSVDANITIGPFQNPFPRFRMSADAEFVFLAIRPLTTPLPIPGFANALEIDPQPLFVVLGASATPPVQFELDVNLLLATGSTPELFVQALDIAGGPAFGSSLRLVPARFR